MGRLRQRLARVAGGWLVCHLAFLLAVPLTLGATLSASGVVAACTCGHGDAQTCPMHHPKSNAASESHPCSCHSTADPNALMAALLIGPTAMLAPAASLIVPVEMTDWTPPAHSDPFESSPVPDSPPPRA